MVIVDGLLNKDWEHLKGRGVLSNEQYSNAYIVLLLPRLMEWDKLLQNPFLAFYQRWPWLCPKYSIYQSLES